MSKFNQQEPIFNQKINSQEIRIVDSDGFDGIYNLSDAMNLAFEKGLDLIEINKTEKNSVCKLMELGKFLYQQKQKKKEQKKKTLTQEVKEIRLSTEISENDLSYRIKSAIDWLKSGDKVKCTLVFKGRQMSFKDKGEVVILRFVSALSEVGQLEFMPKLEGKKMFCLIKPKK